MTKNSLTKIATEAGKLEIVITSIFDALCKLVWKAWVNAELVKQLWGTEGFTAPFCEIDLRGKVLYCMRSPKNNDYWSDGVYRKTFLLERNVFTDSFTDENGNVVPTLHCDMSGTGNDSSKTVLNYWSRICLE